MSFHAILGHDKVTAALAGAIASGRVAHAYLFTGPDGIGKRATAVEFAKALNCRAPAAHGPCDGCASCRKVAAGSHPDVRVVTAASDKTAIGIDQVRAVLKEASLRPYEGARKVFIIDAAGEMKHEAQSIFLKSLEEPSADTVFIMIARRAEDLFPTIVSRSVVVAFRPLGSECLRSILATRYDVPAARAHVIAAISSGRWSISSAPSPTGAIMRRRKSIFSA